jgi:hypothetical protein
MMHMWDMTPFGILMPALRPAETVESGDDRLLQIRTRRAKELDILREKYLPELGETIATPNMDYNFRAYCTHEQYAEAMRLMILDIDYTKFKPTTEDKYKDKELHSVYNSIWGTVCRLGSPGGKWATDWTDYRTTGTRLPSRGTTTGWTGTTAGTRPEPTLAERFADPIDESTPLGAERGRQRRSWLKRSRRRQDNRWQAGYDLGMGDGYEDGYTDGWEDGADYKGREISYSTSSSRFDEPDDVRDGDALWRDINDAVLADLDPAHLDAIRDEAEVFEAERNAEIAKRRGALFFSSGDAQVGGPL